MKTRGDCTRLGKTLAGAATLSALLLFVAVPRLQADNRALCQQRIEQSEARLNEAIRKHGGNSEQANERRRDLNAERDRCWNENHAWWNPGDRQWHNERDWDRDHGSYRSDPLYQTGYNEGLRIGRSDLRSNRAYQPANYKAYKNNGNPAYRAGFMDGYNEGYGRR